eukprot:2340238-Pyramimonas_sp.AAC.1
MQSHDMVKVSTFFKCTRCLCEFSAVRGQVFKFWPRPCPGALALGSSAVAQLEPFASADPSQGNPRAHPCFS